MEQSVNLSVPAGAEKVLRHAPGKIRFMFHVILDQMYKGKHFMPMSSQFMSRVVTGKRYKEFLNWIPKLEPWLDRYDYYKIKWREDIKNHPCVETAKDPAQCKAWRANVDFVRALKSRFSSVSRGENNKGGRGVMVVVNVPAAEWNRAMSFRTAGCGMDDDCVAAVESARSWGGEIDEFSRRSVVDCLRSALVETVGVEAADNAVSSWENAIDGINGLNHFRWDGGGRVYGPLLGLKKQIRRGLLVFPVERVDSYGEVYEFTEGAGEVDVSCCHYFLAAMVFARGVERERLLSLIRSGKFYESFADDGLSRDDAKKQLLMALFMYNCQSEAWKRFSKSFPVMSKAIKEIRDIRSVIRVKDSGRVTRLGQRKMSRILTRAESKVFNRAIARMWRETGISSIRLHDAVMVRESQMGIARDYIQESFQHHFGEDAKLTMKACRK